jgi:hypothetical protein
MKSGIANALLVIASASLMHCGNHASIAGGGVSETTNGFALGVILNQNGSPAAHSRVMLIPNLHDPVIDSAIPGSMIDTTDDQGRYLLKSSMADTFNIQGVNDQSGDRLLISAISIRKNDTTFIPVGTLQRPGAVKIILPDYYDRTSGYLYLQGTTFSAGIENDYAMIDSVPAGIIPSLHYGNAADPLQNRTIKTRFAVFPRNTTLIADYTSWSFSRRVYLNTKVSGADVPNDVFNFPILIRLTAGNFMFNQAKTNGEDLRLAKADSTPLSYEIERWDSAAGVAEVWVKADTVRGNDSTQYLTMFWGASTSSTTAQSNGNAVFDASRGFEGAWHLNQNCLDATSHGNHGTNYGAVDTVGIIGYCKKFNGKDSIKITGLMGSPASVSLSVWASLDTPGTVGADAVSVGDAILIRFDDSWNSQGTEGDYCVNPAAVMDSTHCFTKSNMFYKQTGWHYVTYCVDGAAGVQKLYIDGALSASTGSKIPIMYTGFGTATYIGTHGNGRAGFNFNGLIDEVRICSVVHSPEWVKLCYMNQRADDKLVEFR